MYVFLNYILIARFSNPAAAVVHVRVCVYLLGAVPFISDVRVRNIIAAAAAAAAVRTRV